MGVKFDRWTLLKIVEVIFVVVCLAFKRVTDDEASRLFLYLQKLSREWSLLNNITWSKVGAAVADTTYGGYLIITAALFFGRLTGELPTQRRITEFILLGIGTILFIALGSLSFAALDSVPPDLVDNAAIVGTFSLVTAALFLLDMGGPKAKKPSQSQERPRKAPNSKHPEPRSITQQVYNIEREIEKSEKTHLDSFDQKKLKKDSRSDGLKNGRKRQQNGSVADMDLSNGTRGYQQMKEDFPRKFGIYGKDMVDYGGNETDETEEMRMPPKMQSQSPVWSHIRKGRDIDFIWYR